MQLSQVVSYQVTVFLLPIFAAVRREMVGFVVSRTFTLCAGYYRYWMSGVPYHRVRVCHVPVPEVHQLADGGKLSRDRAFQLGVSVMVKRLYRNNISYLVCCND